MQYTFADRVSGFQASDVRELLKVTQQREIISLGGGLPAPELFPVKEIMAASHKVLAEEGMRALQYSATEGHTPLRDWIADRMNQMNGTHLNRDQILITSGSQQGLDLTGKIFLNKDDVVICESPTYLAAITAFRAYECSFREVAADEDGMLPQALEQALKETPKAKFIYVVTNFQNPTGRTWRLERRQMLYQLAKRYQVVIVEDNPYGEIRFEGEDIPPVHSMDQAGLVISLGTFSKTFCPGYRIGWIAASPEVIEKYILAKQGSDLHTNTLAQMELHRYLQDYNIDTHIAKIKDVYLRRRDLAVETMLRVFPEQVTFTRPEGGLFLWVTLPAHVNARDVLTASLERGVAFVPGASFFPNGGHENTMRINFSNTREDLLVKALETIGQLLHQFI